MKLNKIASNKLKLLGLKFNRLLVIEELESKKQKSRWKCQCDCGNLVFAYGSCLTRGDSRSCGCLKNEENSIRMSVNRKSGKVRKPQHPGDTVSFNSMYCQYRAQAKSRNREFNLTKNEFRTLTQKNCFYCNVEPRQIKKGNKFSKPEHYYIYNGIDRVDSNKGYIIDNCVPCCGICNTMKMKLSQNVFINHIFEIATYQRKRAR